MTKKKVKWWNELTCGRARVGLGRVESRFCGEKAARLKVTSMR
jgi:hypothetical protein